MVEVEYGVSVFSEVQQLTKVLVHSPGPEVEQMTPDMAPGFLFNDIVLYEDIKKQHAQLKGVLKTQAQVLEVQELLEEVVADPTVGAALAQQVAGGNPSTAQTLQALPPKSLAQTLIQGLAPSPLGLQQHFTPKLSWNPLPPLPNTYFTRDIGIAFGNHVLDASMAHSVRSREALIVKTLFQHHPTLRNKGPLGPGAGGGKTAGYSLEGGDVLVLSPNLILVGIGERTTPQALEALLVPWARARGHTVEALCVALPPLKSAIHLDMLLTLVSPNQAVVFGPTFLGPHKSQVVVASAAPKGEVNYRSVASFFEAMVSLGHPIEPILCGGGQSPYDEREQWNSGANFFTFGPGKAICYRMHEHTLRACQAQGFRIYSAPEVLANPALVAPQAPPAIVTIEGSELARGGGGPRCMTCPISRQSPLGGV